MSKKPKSHCAHGMKPITVSGCAQCVQDALFLCRLCQRLGCNGGELVDVLTKHYKTWGELKDAVDAVKADNAKTDIPSATT